MAGLKICLKINSLLLKQNETGSLSDFPPLCDGLLALFVAPVLVVGWVDFVSETLQSFIKHAGSYS